MAGKAPRPTWPICRPVVPGFAPKTRVQAVGRVLRVEQARGIEGRDGFAILSRHSLLRVNNHSDGQTAP